MAVPVPTYSFGILEWMKSEIDKMDRKKLFQCTDFIIIEEVLFGCTLKGAVEVGDLFNWCLFKAAPREDRRTKRN